MQKNGARLEGGLMIGVRPLDSLDRAAVETGGDRSASALPAAMAAWRAAAAPLPSRPYLLTQPPAVTSLSQASSVQLTPGRWSQSQGLHGAFFANEIVMILLIQSRHMDSMSSCSLPTHWN